MRRCRGFTCGAVVSAPRNMEPRDEDNALTNNNFQRSWGETRTPDPGIMSAVL